MHNVENRCVTGLSNILFAGVYACSFQPRHFTGWGNEGVNIRSILLLLSFMTLAVSLELSAKRLSLKKTGGRLGKKVADTAR